MSAAALKQIDIFEQRLPPRPLCADSFADGLMRASKQVAMTKRHIQINSPVFTGFLAFDVDREFAAISWVAPNLPAPSFVVQNQKNGHCHLIYMLEAPVCTSDAARLAPIKLLAAIQYAFTEALGADFSYTNVTAKTPFHKSWRTLLPANDGGLYDLNYLAEHVELPKKIPKRREAVGLGRNCSLFSDLSQWAYKAVRSHWRPDGEKGWREAVLNRAIELNEFSPPLATAEIKGIAKSVSRWVWRNFTPAGFRAVQSKRGKVGNKKSVAVRAARAADMTAEAVRLRAEGKKIKEIMELLGASRATVQRWLKADC
jgi:hypothetical protein